MSRSFPHSVIPQSSAAAAEFSLDERRLLLALAHESIRTAIANQRPAERQFSPHLSESRGVFTTLHLRGELRGCVGYALPIFPLHQAVFETARAAAFEDTRFVPVSETEAPELGISLSVLSLLFSIQPEDVIVGRHGLVVSLGPFRGLLLPQVPLECGWDRETFLEQTCRKAGLPIHSWRKGAKLEAFTAEVFSDSDVRS